MPELDLAINNASYLITCDESGSIFRNYSIGIQAGEIVEISKSPLQARTIFDASNKLISPGLVNTHTHLAMSLLRGYAEGVDLQGFLERVWAAEGAIMDGPTAELGTKLGALEALLGGTTTTLDMYLFPEDTHRGAVATGLRHVAGPIFFDFPGLDGMEWPARIDFARSWPEILRKIGGAKVPVYLMPHATYTCSPEHLTEIAELAEEIDASIHIHISENLKENQDVAARYEMTPTQLLIKTGLMRRHCVYGHGVHLTQSDLAGMKGKAAVAHCPGSNLKLASGIADITNYRNQGIMVGLGTDGCSSSNDLDMWPVMRIAGYLVANNNGPEKSNPESIFRMATIEGARALGMADLIGSIEVGKRADLIAIDLVQPHLIPIHNIYAQLVFAAGRSDVSDVFVDGTQVIADGRSTKIDFAKLKSDVTDRVSKL
jgi:5-methylthioadenosine/S-adenosylhomocysteine deaminase